MISDHHAVKHQGAPASLRCGNAFPLVSRGGHSSSISSSQNSISAARQISFVSRAESFCEAHSWSVCFMPLVCFFCPFLTIRIIPTTKHFFVGGRNA